MESRIISGTVRRFDTDTGLGEVVDVLGAVWPFHCTAIADGTRHIETGTSVWFVVRPGWGGTWEATGITTR